MAATCWRHDLGLEMNATSPTLPWKRAAVVGIITCLWYWILIDATPATYSWDAFARIWWRDHIFVRHWLPVPQAFLALATRWTDSLVYVRLGFAIVSALSVTAYSVAVARIWNARVGTAAGILLATLPTFQKFAIVPYQEGFMVLFFSAYLLATHANGVRSPSHPNLAASTLSLALLTRYEVWLFAVTLAIGAAFRRWDRQLTIMLPGLIVVGAWVVSTPLRTYHPAPLQLGPTFRTELLHESAGVVLSLANLVLEQLVSRIHKDWTLAGAVLFLAGMWFLRKRSDWTGRELPIVALAALLLALALGINSLVLTSRMMLPFFTIGIPYLAVGLSTILNRRAKKWSAMLFWTFLCIFAVRGAVTGLLAAKDASLRFKPEQAAASRLERLPRDTIVEIHARSIPNPWQASAVTAIFGNSLKLDPKSGQWILSGTSANSAEEPEFILHWDGEEYRLAGSRRSDEAVAQGTTHR